MKSLALILLGFAVMAGAVWLAVETIADRETVIPPPDAAAEGFFRAVVNQRWSIAREYLQEPDSVTDDAIRSLRMSIYYRCAGDVHDVSAELVSRTDEQAMVTTRLESNQGSTALPVQLVWSKGEWKVKGLPTS